MTKEVKELYLAQVDRELIRQLRLREQLMTEARRLVDQFDEENPEAEYADLETAFGTPEKFVAEMLSTVPSEQVENAKRKNAFHHRAIRAAVVLVLVAAALFFFWRWQKAQEVVNGDFKIVIDPAEDLTDKEMEALLKQTPTDAQSHTGG